MQICQAILLRVLQGMTEWAWGEARAHNHLLGDLCQDRGRKKQQHGL